MSTLEAQKRAFKDAKNRFKSKEPEFPLHDAQIKHILRMSNAISHLSDLDDIKGFLESLGYDVVLGFQDSLNLHIKKSTIEIPVKEALWIEVPEGQDLPKAVPYPDTRLPGQDDLDQSLRVKAKQKWTIFNRKRKV